MDAALYDLAPVLRIALLGIAVASGPLGWIWLRNRQAAPGQRRQQLYKACIAVALLRYGIAERRQHFL